MHLVLILHMVPWLEHIGKVENDCGPMARDIYIYIYIGKVENDYGPSLYENKCKMYMCTCPMGYGHMAMEVCISVNCACN